MRQGRQMERFAFIVHPLTVQDISRKFSFVKRWPSALTERMISYLPPFTISHITGIDSGYNQAEGWLIACPLTSQQLLSLPAEQALGKIIKAGKIAEKLGAGIVGLGAFTSIVGDGGITVAKQLNIAVTTGNSYTVATAIGGIERAAAQMGIAMHDAHIVILGATGSVGAACAQLLAVTCKRLTLTARNTVKLEKLADSIMRATGLAVRVTSNNKDAVKQADIIVAVTSAVDSLIEPEDIKSGAVVCDVARPRNVSQRVAAMRNDVLVIEGGIVEVPGYVDFGFDFGFPAGMAYACMAETMILALEKRYENFSLGRELAVRQVETIKRLGTKHGFRLAGFRSFERPILDADIATIKRNAELGLCAAGREIG